jgi:hypothetical protein
VYRDCFALLSTDDGEISNKEIDNVIDNIIPLSDKNSQHAYNKNFFALRSRVRLDKAIVAHLGTNTPQFMGPEIS